MVKIKGDFCDYADRDNVDLTKTRTVEMNDPNHSVWVVQNRSIVT